MSKSPEEHTEPDADEVGLSEEELDGVAGGLTTTSGLVLSFKDGTSTEKDDRFDFDQINH